jgi:hypothetical protein
MKKIILYSFSIFIALSAMVACRKSDNPRIPDLERVPQPQLTVTSAGDATIAFQNPDAFKGVFTVGLYAPGDTPPAKMDIVVRKNGVNTNVKVFQADVTTFPTTLTVTGVQLKALFGAIALGDTYEFGANVTTQQGKVYPAFATDIVSGTTTVSRTQIGTGVTTQANATPTITFAAACKFTMTDYGAIGSTVPFTIVTDGWQDYAVGATINVTIIDATHLSFLYGANNAKPIIITVNPSTNATTVAKQVYGDYGDSYGNYSVNSVANNAANLVTPCELAVSVRLTHSVSAGGFGDYTIKFKKK